MPIAFIVMQIGNVELDRVCSDAIVPAIKACGLDPKRVDKHNEGGLLKSEIIKFIHESDIIVADVTNERPNCYLEIGYAMGMDKFRNLILTVREDHLFDSPNFVRGGPKVHFDLAGYDILPWHTDDLKSFQNELEKRIRRRLLIMGQSKSRIAAAWDEGWIEAQRKVAETGLLNAGLSGTMEIRFALESPKPEWSPQELNEAARWSPIRTFGWPIGIYLSNRDEYRPKARADGIVAEVSIPSRPSYDYWAIKRNGDFYSLSSLFEDRRVPGHLFFDTRIIRATEALLYCARLYSRLGVGPSSIVHVAMRLDGLKDRVLTAANVDRRDSLDEQQRSAENEIETETSVSLQGIEANLVSLVRELVGPAFTMFDFFEPSDSIYEEIVNKFVRGHV